MASTVKRRAKRANRKTDTSVGKSRHIRRSISPILLKFAKDFPRQTPVELAIRTGASPRHCERVLGGHGALGEKFLIALLRSDFGKVAYFEIMAGCAQPWFVRLQRQFDLSEARQAVTRTLRSLEALEAAE
jgi:hypothetical protein